MSAHTKTPWMTQQCGPALPDDVMIVADLGGRDDGVQLISTVARALSVRQTPAVTKANAEFIVRAANSHDDLVAALKTVAQQHALFVGPDDDIANATKEVVRAALAKAESPL